PVVGFHGAIREWVDLAMVESVANARPEYTFVLVGPPNEAVEEAMARLDALENVVLVPEKPSAEVAAYVRSFTVGTVPFEVTTMTQGVTPIKLYEYLASGVPVVASPLPSCVAHPLVAVADDVESWVRALDEAVAI